MPLRVMHPVRVVIDSTMLDPARAGVLAEAVEAGVTRAARAGRDRVLATLPAGTQITVAAPETSWTGAAAHLSADRKAAVEGVIAGAIARALDAAGIAEGRWERAAPTGDRRVAEAVDEGRFSAPLRRYVVPSYRGGHEAVPVTGGADREHELEPVSVWASVTTENFTERFWVALSEREHLWPTSGLLGALFQRADGNYGVGAVRFPDQTVLPDFSFDRHLFPRFEDPAAGGRRLDLDPSQVYRLRYSGDGSDAGWVIPAHYRDGFLARAAQRHPRLPGQHPDDHRRSLMALVEDGLQARVAAAGKAGVTSFLLLSAGSFSTLLQLVGQPDWVRPGLDLVLLPLSDRVRPRTADQEDGAGLPADAGDSTGGAPAAGSGTATADPGGAGAAGPPADGSGQAGQDPRTGTVWPAIPLRGDPLFCAPFLGEPEAAVAADGAVLLAWIRRLARQLQVPECEFAGQFALNCAAVIGARARSVGVRAIQSADTTDVSVRVDGSGNNGYVHVRPGDSAQLADLRLLARIGAELHEFARAVIDRYSRAPTGEQLRAAGSAGGWELRFLEALAAALGDAFEVVFSETCRVLLLAQLRSSARGIAGRQQAFPATLTVFTQSVDAFGPRIVQFSALRRALEHSIQMRRTGTVREVLNTTTARPVPVGEKHGNVENDDAPIPAEPQFEGGRIEIAAPLQDYPEAVLAVIENLRVSGSRARRTVDFMGRTWTVEDLGGEINKRRSVLNHTDPLFFQIGDITEVFSGSGDDHDRTRKFLADLLEDMAAANEAMRRKASHEADGAEFAVGAAQYVRQVGGTDWRGLTFELHGLHLLADEQLRPVVGGDRLYAEGLNRALRHKADLDDVLGLAASAGVIVLGLLCAPLGAVAASAITGLAGIGLAWHDVDEAMQKTEAYRSLDVDPALLQRWEDVQAAQITALLSVAFSVFDVGHVGKAAHELVGAVRLLPKAVERAGMAGAAREAFAATRRAALKNLSAEVLQKAAREAVQAGAVAAVMGELLPRVISPALVPWLEEQARLNGSLTPVEQDDVRRILAELKKDQR